ncbi:MAG: DMT family transporter [Chloroflexi bacterium]|nr:DMT family transporter [Chloroflexota bacterium]
MKNNQLINHPIAHITVLGTLFGMSIVASRFSIGQFAPLTFVGLRLTLASLCFVILYLISQGKRKWPKDGLLWRRATFLGVIGTAVPMAAFVSSLQYQSSGITSTLITISPAITVLLAHFFLPDERLTFSKSFGVALAFSGALFLALRGESGLVTIGRVNPIGYGLVFLGISCSSVSNIYIRKKMLDFAAMDVAAVRMLTAALTAMPIALLSSDFNLKQVNAQGWLVLLFAAIVGTFFAFLLDFYNTQRFGASTAVMVSYVVPIVGVLGGAILLDEQITGGMLGGMLLIVLGVGFILRRQTAVQQEKQIHVEEA